MSGNTAIGVDALTANEGANNTATGVRALSHNVSGWYNTANGYYALNANTTGEANTAYGARALWNNTTGHFNVAIGGSSLAYSMTGSYNTAIGYYTDVPIPGNLNNVIAIGYSASPTSSNQVQIGNMSITSIGGYADWTNFSDKRAKKNIREDVPGLAFINQLQPVTYNLDLDAVDGLLKIDKTKRPGKEDLPRELIDIEKKAREAKEKQIQTGFLAQDVEKVAKSIGYDFSGVDVDEIGIYGLRYAEFVVPLVKAVQELSTQNEQLRVQNDQMQAQISELTGLVSGLLGKDADQDRTSSDASLQQNIPNPFNQSTVIRYILPQACKSAQIVITNPAGNVVRQIPLSASGGTDSITIEGGALAAGIYYYSLYVDGSLIDTKQMILTK
jgi:hypothetical protein